jgi:hypothetical protein
MIVRRGARTTRPPRVLHPSSRVSTGRGADHRPDDRGRRAHGSATPIGDHASFHRVRVDVVRAERRARGHHGDQRRQRAGARRRPARRLRGSPERDRVPVRTPELESRPRRGDATAARVLHGIRAAPMLDASAGLVRCPGDRRIRRGHAVDGRLVPLRRGRPLPDLRAAHSVATRSLRARWRGNAGAPGPRDDACRARTSS